MWYRYVRVQVLPPQLVETDRETRLPLPLACSSPSLPAMLPTHSLLAAQSYACITCPPPPPCHIPLLRQDTNYRLRSRNGVRAELEWLALDPERICSEAKASYEAAKGALMLKRWSSYSNAWKQAKRAYKKGAYVWYGRRIW